jgi:beta-lactamase superfamily II metal-dependent hydrolase
MLRIEMLPAEYGDCLWIEYGKSEDKIHRVLIDGGTLGCGKVLQKRITALEKKERRFDLVVVTHIDSDHIDGMVRLMQDLPDGFEFDNFWFNAYDHTRPEGFLGAKQGEYLTVELLELEKIQKRKFWNESFGRKAAMIPDSGKPVTVELTGGMKMTVLGPDSEGLSNLRKQWAKVIKEAGMTPGNLAEAMEKLKKDRRFRPGWLGDVDVTKLAKSSFKEDESPSNGSSIILLAEYDNKKILFCGDAFPTNIINGLKRLPSSGGTRTKLDLFKVPHHGSKNNNSNELYKAFAASGYLVSTNGKKFGHPDDEGIARIINNKRGKTALYFNYSHNGNKLWANKKLQTQYDFSTEYATTGNLKIVL